MSSRFIYFLTLFVIFCRDINAARILGLFPHSGKSHFMVFEPILTTLAERGHDVTVVSFFPHKAPPENYTHINLQGITELGVEVVNLSEFERHSELLKMLGVERIVRQIVEYHRLAQLALEICENLVNWSPLLQTMKNKYDVVLMENFNSDCMLGLLEIHKINAPIIGLLSTSLMPWSARRIGVSDNPSYVPVISSGFADKMTFLQRLENTFINCYLKLWYRYAIQVKEQEIIEKRYRRRITDLGDLEKRMTLMMTNSFHSFNGNRPLVPGLLEVGGVHLGPKPKTITRFIERFLNESDHGVILFSLGSLVKTSTMPKYKHDLIVSVLNKLKQRVLWKYEDSAEEGTLMGNILKVKWIPQYELLKHDKVVAFIAHGGMLGMTEALSAGKPMVLMPFYGDQPLNAASAAKVGLGTVISYMDLTEKSFNEAIQKVLSTEMRESARRISRIWHDRQNSPMDTAIYHIERVIRWGHQDPLHSPARDLALYEYLLLDVIAAYVIAIILIVLALRSIALLTFRVLINLRKEKVKMH